jgi:hypothetical protein
MIVTVVSVQNRYLAKDINVMLCFYQGSKIYSEYGSSFLHKVSFPQ